MHSGRMRAARSSTVKETTWTETLPPWTETPPACRQTNASENITFPQLRLRAVLKEKKSLKQDSIPLGWVPPACQPPLDVSTGAGRG